MKRLFAISLVLLLAGCSHKSAQVAVPPAPRPERQQSPAAVEADSSKSAEPSLPEQIEVPPDTKPLLVETGIASWYGPPYDHRMGSNGEIYDMHAMTAAHRTLPLGSTVRVTSSSSGKSVIVRITDRGPFIQGRIIDLSQAAARQIDLIRSGTGEVRIELLETPQPLESGGKWAVQIGGFEREKRAREIADHLSHRYHSAQVRTFNSPAGDWWVRVRVKDDLRARAEEVIRDTRTSEGAVFLVRLD
jgi:rare lipoprotein A